MPQRNDTSRDSIVGRRSSPYPAIVPPDFELTGLDKVRELLKMLPKSSPPPEKEWPFLSRWRRRRFYQTERAPQYAWEEILDALNWRKLDLPPWVREYLKKAGEEFLALEAGADARQISVAFGVHSGKSGKRASSRYHNDRRKFAIYSEVRQQVKRGKGLARAVESTAKSFAVSPTTVRRACREFSDLDRLKMGAMKKY